MDIELESTVQNLIDQHSLKWIFVGGKGGVGKTTTSSSLAVLMSSHRKKVLIISTDPAHNLGDSFQQSLTYEPTLIKGYENLYAMETQSKLDASSIELPDFLSEEEGSQSFWAEAISSAPGIDEVIVFSSVMKTIEPMGFDLVIFDTAPTGHTLKLLNFPNTMEKALNKLLSMKEKFKGITQMFGGDGDFNNMFNKTFERMEAIKSQSEKFKNILTNPDECQFVAVCIPEYLSVYETERLCQELVKSDIEIRNIVVNQIVIPESE